MNCPICEKPSVSNYKPFCSKRCADVDLAKWLNGGYAIPSQVPEDADEAMDELERLAQSGESSGSEKLH